MKEFADFVSALAHRLEPCAGDGSQFAFMVFQPLVDGRVALASAVESQQFRSIHGTIRSTKKRESALGQLLIDCGHCLAQLLGITVIGARLKLLLKACACQLQSLMFASIGLLGCRFGILVLR